MGKRPGAKAGKAKPKKDAKPKAKGRSVKNTAGADNKPPVKSETKQIDVDAFQNLHRRRTSLKKQGKELNGSAGELLTSAAENKNLDKPAYGFIEKLWAMSPQKRITTLACFDFYRTIPHFGTKKKLDEDETGQGELDIPRQEAAPRKPRAPAHDPAGAAGGKGPTAETANGNGGEPAKAAETTAGPANNGTEPKDLRPPHLRTVAEGGTRVDHVEDLKQKAAAGATH